MDDNLRTLTASYIAAALTAEHYAQSVRDVAELAAQRSNVEHLRSANARLEAVCHDLRAQLASKQAELSERLAEIVATEEARSAKSRVDRVHRYQLAVALCILGGLLLTIWRLAQ